MARRRTLSETAHLQSEGVFSETAHAGAKESACAHQHVRMSKTHTSRTHHTCAWSGAWSAHYSYSYSYINVARLRAAEGVGTLRQLSSLCKPSRLSAPGISVSPISVPRALTRVQRARPGGYTGDAGSVSLHHTVIAVCMHRLQAKPPRQRGTGALKHG